MADRHKRRRPLRYLIAEIRLVLAEWLFFNAALRIAPEDHRHAMVMIAAVHWYCVEILNIPEDSNG